MWILSPSCFLKLLHFSDPTYLLSRVEITVLISRATGIMKRHDTETAHCECIISLSSMEWTQTGSPRPQPAALPLTPPWLSLSLSNQTTLLSRNIMFNFLYSVPNILIFKGTGNWTKDTKHCRQECYHWANSQPWQWFLKYTFSFLYFLKSYLLTSDQLDIHLFMQLCCGGSNEL